MARKAKHKPSAPRRIPVLPSSVDPRPEPRAYTIDVADLDALAADVSDPDLERHLREIVDRARSSEWELAMGLLRNAAEYLLKSVVRGLGDKGRPLRRSRAPAASLRSAK